MDDYQMDQQGEDAPEQGSLDLIDLIPTFEGGASLSIGDRLKAADGSLVRVRAVVLTAAGALVTDQDLSVGKLGLVAVPHELASADSDSQEELDADCLLSPRDYCQRRALEVEGNKVNDCFQAMLADVRERQAALCRG